MQNMEASMFMSFFCLLVLETFTGLYAEFTRYNKLNDRAVTANSTTVYACSELGCGVLCSTTVDCSGFSYDSSSGICSLYSTDPFNNPGQFLSSAGTNVYVLPCEDGWEVFGQSCYLFPTTPPLSWESAKVSCKSSGSSLVKVETNYEHQYIRNKISNMGYAYFWIGARYNQTYGEHRWIDGSAILFDGWYPGMPGTSQGCVDYLIQFGTLWNSHSDCVNTLGPYICEKQTYTSF